MKFMMNVKRLIVTQQTEGCSFASEMRNSDFWESLWDYRSISQTNSLNTCRTADNVAADTRVTLVLS